MGVPHRLLEDVEFHGYSLPKGLFLIPNLCYLHMNEGVWGDPQNFRPERFLNSDNSQVVRNENLQAFQGGKRVCIGEAVAKDALFLVVVKLFQAFKISTDPDNPEPSFEPDVGLALMPKPYKVKLESRN